MKTKRRKRTSSTTKRHPRRKRGSRGRRINPAAHQEFLASCVRLAAAAIEYYFPGVLNVPAGSGDYMASSRKHGEVAELERMYRL